VVHTRIKEEGEIKSQHIKYWIFLVYYLLDVHSFKNEILVRVTRNMYAVHLSVPNLCCAGILVVSSCSKLPLCACLCVHACVLALVCTCVTREGGEREILYNIYMKKVEPTL
jgi:hypothetical protein